MPHQDLTVKLIARIKNLISSGVLVPGSKLPPERELASHFGVSRPSLRQALKVLEIMGIISQRVGDGTYLNENISEILNEPMEFLILMDGISIHELVELRSIMEPELAALAAARATVEDLGALERAINQHEASPRDLAKSIEADLNFHKAILRAAGNRACSRLLAYIHKSIWQSLSITSQLVEAQRPLAGHKAIYSAIYGRDSSEARQQMSEHMRRAKLLLIEASRRPVDLSLARKAPKRASNGKPRLLSARHFGSVIRKTPSTSKPRTSKLASQQGGRPLKRVAQR
jgi:GntR family transcriptional repressor for pyruvate dehydrogenase complex